VENISSRVVEAVEELTPEVLRATIRRANAGVRPHTTTEHEGLTQSALNYYAQYEELIAALKEAYHLASILRNEAEAIYHPRVAVALATKDWMSGQEEAAALAEELGHHCKGCESCCCKGYDGYWKWSDFIFIQLNQLARGQPPWELPSPACEVPTYCQWLTSEGCIIPRLKRPMTCALHVCLKWRENVRNGARYDPKTEYRHKYIGVLQTLVGVRFNAAEDQLDVGWKHVFQNRFQDGYIERPEWITRYLKNLRVTCFDGKYKYADEGG